MARRKINHDELLKKLEYQFQKPELLDEALTHVSAPRSSGKSYQRLEFLGDRVLGLAISEILYATFPKAPEGELSRRLAELVRRESCAEVAIAWDVGPFLRLGAGEAHSGERRNQTILADVCEAIIGAVFLDSGYEAARDLVERAFKAMIEAPRRPLRDPKSVLQEWAQGRGLPPPVYTIAEQTGPDHAPKFRVMVKVKGKETEFGLGASKRVAEQAAARSLLIRERIWREEEHGTV
ncbi:ribonuclease III [Microvirga solisilvae]|uniref:ribonuclease III n=1 Tax=Microvirga solisilvae TaxID=2919498 RepID=UPI003C6D1329